MLTIKQLATNRLSIKVISLIIAYSAWSFFCHQQTVKTTLEIPICFYDLDEIHDIDCPERITITIQGRRYDLNCLDYEYLAMHIDASLLNQGPNQLNPTEKNIFLPPSVKLVNYIPTNLIAILTNKHANN